MTDVFISYARADRARVRLIAHGLTQEGFAVWWDPEIKPGKKWNALISKTLESAAVIVTCWSKTSVKSEWVLAETTRAHERKALVPAMIEKCSPPIPFNMIQGANLTRWRGRAEDPEWEALLEQVRTLVEKKRRFAVADLPPSEAHGAERFAASAADDLGAYQSAPARGKFGPRASRFVLGSVIAGCVLTGSLWAGGGAIQQFLQPKTEDAGAASVPAPEPVLETPVKPAAPLQEPPSASQESAPAPEPAAVKTPITPPAIKGDDPNALDGIDACATALMYACPSAKYGAAEGFGERGRLSPSELDFLRRLSVSVATPIDRADLSACERAQARHDRTSLARGDAQLQRACESLRFPIPPAQKPPVVTENYPPKSTYDPKQPTQPPRTGIDVDWTNLPGAQTPTPTPETTKPPSTYTPPSTKPPRDVRQTYDPKVVTSTPTVTVRQPVMINRDVILTQPRTQPSDGSETIR